MKPGWLKQLTWYARYYNRRHKRSGHLFENRYKSILYDEDTYLPALVRYIHRKPLCAKIVKTAEELNRCPSCRYQTIIGKANHLWMDTDYVLLQSVGSIRKGFVEHRKFMREGGHPDKPERHWIPAFAGMTGRVSNRGEVILR